jgi:hypothetical protein
MSATFNQPARLLETAPTPGSMYTALRMAYGIVMLADVAHLYVHRTLFLATGLWPQFPVGAVSIIWIIALVCLIAGVRTQIAALVNWTCCAIMLGLVAPNDGFQQAACDSVAIGISSLILVLPMIGAGAGRWLLAAYLSSIYLDSGVHKLLSPMWFGGFGVLAPMTLPSLVWIDTGWIGDLPKWLWHAAGYGVVGFELLFPLLYAWRRTRLTALLGGLAMHVGIGIIYPIPAFAGIMLSLYAALLIPELLNQVQPAAPRRRWSLALMTLWSLAILNAYHPPLKALRKAVYMGTGIASHAVFEDDAFLRYTYQLRLVIPAGPVIPYSRGNLIAFDVRDRVWELWWKRTQAPAVRMMDAEAHLRVWAPDARIEARPQTVTLNQIRPALFRDNDRVAWVNVGSIQLGTVHWNRAPNDPQEKLGDYLESVLR